MDNSSIKAQSNRHPMQRGAAITNYVLYVRESEASRNHPQIKTKTPTTTTTIHRLSKVEPPSPSNRCVIYADRMSQIPLPRSNLKSGG